MPAGSAEMCSPAVIVKRSKPPAGNMFKNNQGVFVKHYAPGGNQVQKAIFSFKVKVTRSLTSVSFERASLEEYACHL